MRRRILSAALFFTCGLMILALGVSLTISSGLGASPFDALLVGLAGHIGLTVGSWEVVIALILIGCNSLLTQKRPELLGLITAMITGIGIDLWLYAVSNVTTFAWVQQLLCFGAGQLQIGLGTALYLVTGFAPIPVDRLTLNLAQITRRSIRFSRTLIYLFFLLCALIFSGPIGLGTLLTIGIGGLILQFFMPRIQKLFNSFNNGGTGKKAG